METPDILFSQSNVLVDGRGSACLADFGLSKIKDYTATIARLPTNSQQGTARFMAPEQIGRGITNESTDVYSFAMTMYEVCPTPLMTARFFGDGLDFIGLHRHTSVRPYPGSETP